MKNLSFRSPAFLLALGLLASSALGIGAIIQRYRIILQKDPIYAPEGRQFGALPSETDSWIQVGADRRENAETEVTLGTTNYVSRTYLRKGTGDGTGEKPIVLEFHAAYYTGKIDTVPHVPDRCFVGGGMQLGGAVGDLALGFDTSGWTPVAGAPESAGLFQTRVPNYSDKAGNYVVLPKEPHGMRLRVMEFSNQGKKFYSGYFFIANGGWVSRAEEVRLLAFDLRTKYAYYAKVQVTSTSVASGEDLAKQASSLIGELLPDIMLCLPDWRAVEEQASSQNGPAKGDAGGSGNPSAGGQRSGPG